MNHSDPLILALRRELRALKIGVAVVSLVVVAAGAAAVAWVAARDELTVERINVVDPSGVLRLVISNTERFPPIKLNGKEYPKSARAVQPAGMIFYDATGSELGGIAITDTEKSGRVSALAFDYPNYDAMGLVTRVSPDGKSAVAGLMINSRPPAEMDVAAASKVVQRRIGIQNEDENAEILLADPQGRERIRLRVDAKGDPRIEILDADGRVTFSAPNPRSDETTEKPEAP